MPQTSLWDLGLSSAFTLLSFARTFAFAQQTDAMWRRLPHFFQVPSWYQQILTLMRVASASLTLFPCHCNYVNRLPLLVTVDRDLVFLNLCLNVWPRTTVLAVSSGSPDLVHSQNVWEVWRLS